MVTRIPTPELTILAVKNREERDGGIAEFLKESLQRIQRSNAVRLLQLSIKTKPINRRTPLIPIKSIRLSKKTKRNNPKIREITKIVRIKLLEFEWWLYPWCSGLDCEVGVLGENCEIVTGGNREKLWDHCKIFEDVSCLDGEHACGDGIGLEWS